MAGPAAALGVGAAAFAFLFAFGPIWGFGLSCVVAAVALLSLTAALLLTTLNLPKDRPGLRRVAILILVLGGAAVLLMTPFGSMALAALAVSR